jgi:anhydro-N-acetylmuramic acid kinase
MSEHLMNELYIGLMSGTSLDGVDGVLVGFDKRGSSVVQVRAHARQGFDPALRSELLALNSPGDNELHRAALAGNALARVYASIAGELLALAGVTAQAVSAVGAHGQTVRHRPAEFDGTGYTVQLNNPALLAELCGIDVIADLRSRDVAAGGQGAPLVPAFHRAVFAKPGETVAVLNVGGISNLTALRADSTTLGYDCGPGNSLMDQWCLQNKGTAFDDAGAWAASGKVNEAILALMRADPYFSLPAPKSTGRDLFHAHWLEDRLQQFGSPVSAQDVQATLAELTASVCADGVKADAADAVELLVCGGGALNLHLLSRLAARLPGVRVMPTDERGLPSSQVEACAFAWLARAFVHREYGNLASVTGAAGGRVLGALYPR